MNDIQTEIEKKLGIAVVNPAYPPGHVRRYGATDNTKAIDDAQAVNRAMTPVLTNPISEERLRNTRAWAVARLGSLSGADVIVAAIDELLRYREIVGYELAEPAVEPTRERHRGDEVDPKLAQQAWYHVQQEAVVNGDLPLKDAIVNIWTRITGIPSAPRECRCATYCMLAVGARFDPPLKCRGLASERPPVNRSEKP